METLSIRHIAAFLCATAPHADNVHVMHLSCIRWLAMQALSSDTVKQTPAGKGFAAFKELHEHLLLEVKQKQSAAAVAVNVEQPTSDQEADGGGSSGSGTRSSTGGASSRSLRSSSRGGGGSSKDRDDAGSGKGQDDDSGGDAMEGTADEHDADEHDANADDADDVEADQDQAASSAGKAARQAAGKAARQAEAQQEAAANATDMDVDGGISDVDYDMGGGGGVEDVDEPVDEPTAQTPAASKRKGGRGSAKTDAASSSKKVPIDLAEMDPEQLRKIWYVCTYQAYYVCMSMQYGQRMRCIAYVINLNGGASQAG